MNVERAERIEMIRASAAAIVPADGDLSRPRGLRFGERDFDRAAWGTMADLGWPALLLAEDLGGAEFGMSELCAIAQSLGRGLAPEPVLDTIIATPLLPEAVREAVLSGQQVVVAITQGTFAVTEGGLSGTARGVMAARDADAFVVAVEGVPLTLISRGEGVSVEALSAQDGGTLSAITVSGAQGVALAGDAEALRDRLALAASAYLLGIAERSFELTLDHLRARQQFGKAIGSFQALQHRCSDLLVQLELTRAAVEAAAAAIDDRPGARENALNVARAKARSGDAAMQITREAIQLHGGIGYADESDIGLYLRKAMTMVNQHGSPSAYRRRFAQLSRASA